jgi:hypothetical protein
LDVTNPRCRARTRFVRFFLQSLIASANHRAAAHFRDQGGGWGSTWLAGFPAFGERCGLAGSVGSGVVLLFREAGRFPRLSRSSKTRAAPAPGLMGDGACRRSPTNERGRCRPPTASQQMARFKRFSSAVNGLVPEFSPTVPRLPAPPISPNAANGTTNGPDSSQNAIGWPGQPRNASNDSAVRTVEDLTQATAKRGSSDTSANVVPLTAAPAITTRRRRPRSIVPETGPGLLLDQVLVVAAALARTTPLARAG